MATLISRKHAVELVRERYSVGSLSWLQRLASEHRRPPVYRLNGRSALYDPDEVLAWCEANIRSPKKPATPVREPEPVKPLVTAVPPADDPAPVTTAPPVDDAVAKAFATLRSLGL
jgi:hypothetical protein